MAFDGSSTVDLKRMMGVFENAVEYFRSIRPKWDEGGTPAMGGYAPLRPPLPFDDDNGGQILASARGNIETCWNSLCRSGWRADVIKSEGVPAIALSKTLADGTVLSDGGMFFEVCTDVARMGAWHFTGKTIDAGRLETHSDTPQYTYDVSRPYTYSSVKDGGLAHFVFAVVLGKHWGAEELRSGSLTPKEVRDREDNRSKVEGRPNETKGALAQIAVDIIRDLGDANVALFQQITFVDVMTTRSCRKGAWIRMYTSKSIQTNIFKLMIFLGEYEAAADLIGIAGTHVAGSFEAPTRFDSKSIGHGADVSDVKKLNVMHLMALRPPETCQREAAGRVFEFLNNVKPLGPLLSHGCKMDIHSVSGRGYTDGSKYEGVTPVALLVGFSFLRNRSGSNAMEEVTSGIQLLSQFGEPFGPRDVPEGELCNNGEYIETFQSDWDEDKPPLVRSAENAFFTEVNISRDTGSNDVVENDEQGETDVLSVSPAIEVAMEGSYPLWLSPDTLQKLLAFSVFPTSDTIDIFLLTPADPGIQFSSVDWARVAACNHQHKRDDSIEFVCGATEIIMANNDDLIILRAMGVFNATPEAKLLAMRAAHTTLPSNWSVKVKRIRKPYVPSDEELTRAKEYDFVADDLERCIEEGIQDWTVRYVDPSGNELEVHPVLTELHSRLATGNAPTPTSEQREFIRKTGITGGSTTDIPHQKPKFWIRGHRAVVPHVACAMCGAPGYLEGINIEGSLTHTCVNGMSSGAHQHPSEPFMARYEALSKFLVVALMRQMLALGFRLAADGNRGSSLLNYDVVREIALFLLPDGAYARHAWEQLDEGMKLGVSSRKDCAPRLPGNLDPALTPLEITTEVREPPTASPES